MLNTLLALLYTGLSFVLPAPAISEAALAAEPVAVKIPYSNQIIVSVLAKDDLEKIFKEIEETGYQLRDVKTVRPVTPGRFSWHSYGLAVDINPKQNPCLSCGDQESLDWPGGAWVAGKNGALTKQVVDIFKKHGWCWGGDWCSKKDYMHFSKPIGLPQYDECAIGTCPYFKK